MFIREQLLAASKSQKSLDVLQARGGWFYDPLLYSIEHSSMRHLRCLRIQSSCLRAHTWFSYANKSKLCDTCSCPETVAHYFMSCKKYESQRREFISSVTPLLTSLGQNYNPQSVLGFIPGLERRKYEKETRLVRGQILRQTLRYIDSTKRFEPLIDPSKKNK